MTKHSAGILLYRRGVGRIEVFLVHPGGPFWRNKDDAAWSIPKGEFEPPEEPLDAAKREVAEETGLQLEGPFLALAPQKQPGGKIVSAWAVEGEADPASLRSNSFALEWPPRSGKTQSFPEIDRAAWFDLETARRKIHRGQIGFLDDLAERLTSRPKPRRSR
jgi:predicted NUDIX family NTP pyrophosphohydrolase